MTIRGVLGGIGCAILTLCGAMVIASIISMACASKAHGQNYRWPDRPRLEAMADSAGVNRKAVLAVAWEETAANMDPKVRGHHCWYTLRERTDTVRTVSFRSILWIKATDADTLIEIRRRLRIVHHEKNCEVGRMQIKPSTARIRCPGKDIFTYDGNLACFAKMFAEDAQMGNTLYGGTIWAIRHHNGAGPQADAYVKRVLQTIGWLTVTEGA